MRNRQTITERRTATSFDLRFSIRSNVDIFTHYILCHVVIMYDYYQTVVTHRCAVVDIRRPIGVVPSRSDNLRGRSFVVSVRPSTTSTLTQRGEIVVVVAVVVSVRYDRGAACM